MFTQVLQRQPVLRQRLLLPYVPLLALAEQTCLCEHAYFFYS